MSDLAQHVGLTVQSISGLSNKTLSEFGCLPLNVGVTWLSLQDTQLHLKPGFLCSLIQPLQTDLNLPAAERMQIRGTGSPWAFRLRSCFQAKELNVIYLVLYPLRFPLFSCGCDNSLKLCCRPGTCLPVFLPLPDSRPPC